MIFFILYPFSWRAKHDRPTFTANEKDTMVAVRIESVDVELLNVPPNFSRDVGWPGGALCLLALTLAGLHLYIAAESTLYFQDIHREGIWFFFCSLHCSSS